MPTLKEHLFQESVSKSLNRLRSEFRDKYKPKKDGRFECHGITYEISSPLVTRDGMEFEISSKIPVELLSARATKEKYFKAIKDIISKKDKAPSSVDMENIVTSLSLSEKKERDYVKAKYIYSENELYDSNEITKKVDKFKKNPEDIPVIPGVTTLFGRLVLQSIEEQIYKKARENILSFINANEEIRKKYS
ncbi:MAG: hypothetical protein HZA00_06645 [Nitrospinae bacterium]|nr:hypothetical protein [Nitrospinota bacterium]